MKKRTKTAAVVSAAALLTMGMSMSSFAAGWTQEDGDWYYYDKDGNKTSDEWRKSGDNWYWLDSDRGGAMAVEKLIVDDDDIYYVNADGAMVRNTWVKLPNEEQDDKEDPAEYHYYYMQADGKAYKASAGGSTKFKTIDGKKYAFDEDGRMLYGWVNGQSERLTGDTDWNANSEDEDIYYLGSWEDGAMKTGWQKLTVCDDLNDEDEKDFWFWFKSNGKKYTAEKGSLIREDKLINGKKYGFDERGVMAYAWVLATSDTASAASTSNWRYFSSPEDGARVSKGWFKVVAPNERIENTFLNYNDGSFASEHADDETERWYYADKNGKLYEGEIKKINGQYYGFYPDSNDEKGGAMLTGLCALKVVNGRIEKVIKENMDLEDLLNCMDPTDEFLEMHLPGSNCSLYYFGNSPEDGAMKTGQTTVMLSGIPVPFEFSKNSLSSGRGKGITGIKDGKYIYKFGYKATADAYEKYKVMYATGSTKDDSSLVFRVDPQKLGRYAEAAAGQNKDGYTVHYVGTLENSNPPYIWESGNVFYLVDTSGRIIKDKAAAKDGYDWYYYVEDKQIKMYTDSKELSPETKDAPVTDALGHVLKKDWKKETISTGGVRPTIMDIIDYDGDVAALGGYIQDYIESLISGSSN